MDEEDAISTTGTNDSSRMESSTDDGEISQELPTAQANYYQSTGIYAIPCGLSASDIEDMNWRIKSNQSLKTLPSDFTSVAENNNGALANSRHSAHYFSNLNLFSDSGYSYLKYAKYCELQSNQGEQRKQPPLLNVLRTTFSLDSRTTLDKVCLRLPNRIPVIKEASFEMSSGDIMALLYTSDYEMRMLLRVLSGTIDGRGKTGGEILLNGKPQNANQLSGRIALVRNDELESNLTVLQILRLHRRFSSPPRSRQVKIEILLASLALSRFKHTLCSKLGKTEKQRVKLAAQLLRDTDILLCENITEGMDVFDVGFTIDYLRSWALRRNRIVILAITPSSIEMLQMFSKVLILASGRVTYFGPPDDMLPYFESINFPCPLFKNPCDYYVDLATHDHLTAEASRESLRRISELCGKWAHRERLPILPPPSTLPPIAGRAGFFKSIVLVYRMYCLESINSPVLVFREPLACLLISGLLSLVFLKFPTNRRNTADDRLGLVFGLLYLAHFPLIPIWISTVEARKRVFVADRREGLYGSGISFVAQLFFDTPFVLISSIALAAPILLLTEFIKTSIDYSTVISFVLPIMFIYTISRFLVFSVTNFFSTRSSSFMTSVIVITVFLLLSGLSISFNDLLEPIRTISSFTPMFVVSDILMHQQFLGTSFTNILLNASSTSIELLIGCERRQILARKIGDIPIYGVSHCSKSRGRQLLHFFGFDSNPPPSTSILISLAILFSWIIGVLFLFCCSVRMSKAKFKRN